MSMRRAVFTAILLAASGIAGAQAPASRYELLLQDEEVLDKETQLIWRRCAFGMRLAQNRCVGEPSGDVVGRDGLLGPVRKTPWRLPTQAELLSLVSHPNPSGGAGKSVVDEVAFPDTPRSRFQANYEGGSLMLYVDFSTGRPGSSRPLYSYLVRAVRDGPENKPSGTP